MKGKKDMIRAALQDSRNGTISTIYQRIHRTGSPFKTADARCKRGGIIKSYADGKITPQLVRWRLSKGWDIERATTELPRIVRSKTNEQDAGKDIPDTILAE